MPKLPGRYQQFREQFPAVARAYDQVGQTTAAAGPLDEKTAQLIKLAMAIGSGHEGAVHSHTRRARDAGASADELRHVAILGLTTLGFPRMMTGLAWVDDVLGGGLGGKRRARSSR